MPFAKITTQISMFVKGEQIMYSVFEQLLQEKGVSRYQVSKETGIPQTTLSTWKVRGTDPSVATMKKLADYFGVTMEYLATGVTSNPVTSEDTPYYNDPEVRQIANDIYQNEDLRILMDASRDISSDDLRMITDLVRKIKKSQED